MEGCLLITLMDVCAYVSTECSGLMMTGEFTHIQSKCWQVTFLAQVGNR